MAPILIAIIANITFERGGGVDGVGFSREAFVENIVDFDFDSGAVSLHCEVSRSWFSRFSLQISGSCLVSIHFLVYGKTSFTVFAKNKLRA